MELLFHDIMKYKLNEHVKKRQLYKNLLHYNPILFLRHIQLWIAQPGYDIRHNIVQRVAFLRQLFKEQPRHSGHTRVLVSAA